MNSIFIHFNVTAALFFFRDSNKGLFVDNCFMMIGKQIPCSLLALRRVAHKNCGCSRTTAIFFIAEKRIDRSSTPFRLSCWRRYGTRFEFVDNTDNILPDIRGEVHRNSEADQETYLLAASYHLWTLDREKYVSLIDWKSSLDFIIHKNHWKYSVFRKLYHFISLSNLNIKGLKLWYKVSVLSFLFLQNPNAKRHMHPEICISHVLYRHCQFLARILSENRIRKMHPLPSLGA